MSPKELLYIEDALGHEEHLKTKCKEYSTTLQDTQLGQMAAQLATKHQEIYKKIYALLQS